MSDTHDLERFKAHAETVQALETVVRRADGWAWLSSVERQAVNVALDTVARVLHGDMNVPGVWLCGGAALALAGEFRALDASEPQPDADGWIKWNGGACPVPIDTKVDVKLRANNKAYPSLAGSCDWRHIKGPGDIIAYRVVK